MPGSDSYSGLFHQAVEVKGQIEELSVCKQNLNSDSSWAQFSEPYSVCLDGEPEEWRAST